MKHSQENSTLKIKHILHPFLFLFFFHPLVSFPRDLIPRGDVFDPLFSDPKEIRSTVNYLWLSSDGGETSIALIGFGEHWGLLRWKGRLPNEGWQIGITGGIFAQFDLHTISKDLMNADYLVGIPISWRRNKSSARFRIYHQSSHLGDEYLLSKHPTRIDLSYESMEFIYSHELGPWRPYVGGEWLFRHFPRDLKPLVSHMGLEFHQALRSIHSSSSLAVHWIAAIDIKTTQEHGTSTGWDLKTGIEFSPNIKTDALGRKWSLTLDYYQGPSPYSQFYTAYLKYLGMGFQLGV